MAASLEHLRPPHNWPEWTLHSGTSVADLGSEVAAVLKEFGLMYFEKFRSLPKCVDAWEKGIAHNLGPSADFIWHPPIGCEAKENVVLTSRPGELLSVLKCMRRITIVRVCSLSVNVKSF